MSNLKVEKRDIDGLEVEVTQHPPMAALPLFTRLGRSIGPAFFAVLEHRNDLLQNAEVMLPVILDVFEKLGGDELQVLARELLRATSVTVDGKRWSLDGDDKLNNVFAGRLPAIFKVMSFAAEVNFGNFFEGWRAQKAAPAKESPST